MQLHPAILSEGYMIYDDVSHGSKEIFEKDAVQRGSSEVYGEHITSREL